MAQDGIAWPEALLAALAELAKRPGSTQAQLAAAAHILVAARADALAAQTWGGTAAGLAATWDSAALTAREFAEQLPAADLFALLAAA